MTRREWQMRIVDALLAHMAASATDELLGDDALDLTPEDEDRLAVAWVDVETRLLRWSRP